MALTKRGKFYHYEFLYKGERFRGSTKKTRREEAESEEQRLRIEIMKNKGADDEALNKLRLEIIRSEKGDSLVLGNVWSNFEIKYKSTSSNPSSADKTLKYKYGFWKDFYTFVIEKHTNIKTLRDVTDNVAEEYKAHLVSYGKYCKGINYKSGHSSVNYNSKIKNLSPSTINEYITQIKHVFKLLSKDAGLLSNPFENVKKLKKKSAKRDIFELDELKSINNFLEKKETLSLSTNTDLDHAILEPIFIIGINTGLRRSDICNLKWSNISKGFLTVETAKTGTEVNIPINNPLKAFFGNQKKRLKKLNIDSPYISPELQEKFSSTPDGITYRFKKMLKELNIESTIENEEGHRNTSMKGIHSLRHTYCFLLGLNGTPVSTVRQMVGHMTDKMTEYYQLHTSQEAKRRAQKQLENFSFLGIQNKKTDEDIIEEIEGLLESLENNRLAEAIKGKINEFK